MSDQDMRIVRVRKDARYFVASNEPFNDKRLSWEARGVMGYLLSKPDNWEVNMTNLIEQGPAGDTKMRRILAELRSCGYMNRVRITVEHNKFKWETEIYESPSLNPRPASRGFSTSGSATSGKQAHIINTEGANTDSVVGGEKPANAINLFAEYERRIGPLTPMIADSLPDLEQEHSAHWVLEAIKTAEGAGKRSLNYVTGILKRWKVDGYGTNYPDKHAKQPGKPKGEERVKQSKSKIYEWMQGGAANGN